MRVGVDKCQGILEQAATLRLGNLSSRDVIRTVYVWRSTLYTVRLDRNPVGYFGGKIRKSRQFVGGF